MVNIIQKKDSAINLTNLFIKTRSILMNDI